MKKFMKSSALMLTGALLIAACGNKEQKSEANVNENPTQEKVEVKAVEGRKNGCYHAPARHHDCHMGRKQESRRDDGCMGRPVRT